VVPRTPKCSSRWWSFLPSFGSNKTFTYMYISSKKRCLSSFHSRQYNVKKRLWKCTLDRICTLTHKTKHREERERRERHKKRALFLGLSECAYVRALLSTWMNEWSQRKESSPRTHQETLNVRGVSFPTTSFFLVFLESALWTDESRLNTSFWVEKGTRYLESLY
jgi:hypothetical protein